MKVIIDKINKIPAFEPFNVVIPVETWEELHFLHKAFTAFVNSSEDDAAEKAAMNLFNAVNTEKLRQKQGGITVYPEQEESKVIPKRERVTEELDDEDEEELDDEDEEERE